MALSTETASVAITLFVIIVIHCCVCICFRCELPKAQGKITVESAVSPRLNAWEVWLLDKARKDRLQLEKKTEEVSRSLLFCRMFFFLWCMLLDYAAELTCIDRYFEIV